VAPRRALVVEAGGERFRFYYDLEAPDELHITRQHGTAPEDAIGAFFNGETGPWDEGRKRFHTFTNTHGLFWTRHGHDNSVIVISCFKVGDE
jgi:hypothetical protein